VCRSYLGGKCIILEPTGTMLLSQGGATFVFLFFGGPLLCMSNKELIREKCNKIDNKPNIGKEYDAHFSASIAAMSSGSPSLHLY